MKNNLESRTLEFSRDIIKLANNITKNQVNFRLLDQLIRSATSIGANYREANETETSKDLKNRIRISKKESKETIYWLELLAENNSKNKDEINRLSDEATQLMKILGSIYRKLR